MRSAELKACAHREGEIPGQDWVSVEKEERSRMLSTIASDLREWEREQLSLLLQSSMEEGCEETVTFKTKQMLAIIPQGPDALYYIMVIIKGLMGMILTEFPLPLRNRGEKVLACQQEGN